MIDIAIVGAGPAGLALAQALQVVSPHLNVKVWGIQGKIYGMLKVCLVGLCLN